MFSIIPPSAKSVLVIAGSADDVEFATKTLENATLLAAAAHATISDQPADSFAFVAATIGKPFSDKFLAHVLRVLAPGGRVCLHATSGDAAAAAARSLTLSGFQDTSTGSSTTALVEIVGSKPAWSDGASASLKGRIKAPAAAAVVVTAAAATAVGGVWALGDDDLDDVGLVDDDALLANETQATVAPTDQCGARGEKTVRKKACKDCSCGLKEEEEAEEAGERAEMKKKIAADFKSSCGSCGLGDAFRCSGCPFLGQPAFKAGEVVKLDL
jgi:hypothetical protein